MHALSAAELLDLWDDGAGQAPLHRALGLLSAVYPEMSLQSLADLTIGERDARLLRLREALFGPQMSSVLTCPACRERLDLKLDVGEILAASRPEQPSELSADIAGYSVTFRLPTSLDLLAAASQADAETARSLVFQRCLLSARTEPDDPEHGPLPAEVVSGVVQRMGEADPLADIQLRVTCPSCAQTWRAVFDIVTFLWTEIEAWAARIASDVHILASAYGWNERDILALSPARRQLYLDKVGA